MFVCISIVVDMQLSALKPKLVTQDSAMYDGNSDPQIDVDEDREGKTLTLALCRELVARRSTFVCREVIGVRFGSGPSFSNIKMSRYWYCNVIKIKPERGRE